ncbi:MAG TPA: TRAP transporter substrate-binding protein DctP [Arenimonas sp.]|nr:TRAP transporter substrate-binding protein DctP [Arenimonas sp.]
MIRLIATVVVTLSLLAPVQAQSLKIATLAPEGSSWMRELRTAAAEVKAGSEGRVDIRFYPGGVMGGDAVVMRKMRLGQLQGGVLTSSELSLVYPDAPVYSLPFLFKDDAEVQKARAKVDPMLAKGFEQRGFKMLGVSGVGFAYMMSNKPLRTRADMSGIKLWIPQNDLIAERTFKLGGISPIPLPIGDVFTSLQTGMIDTVANTPSGAVALQWHSRINHMVDLPLSFVAGFMVVDLKAFQRLSAADQAVVEKAFAAAATRMDANVRRDDASALAAMKKQGLKVQKLDPNEEQRWREVGRKLTAELVAEESISAEMLAAMREALGNGSL